MTEQPKLLVTNCITDLDEIVYAIYPVYKDTAQHWRNLVQKARGLQGELFSFYALECWHSFPGAVSEDQFNMNIVGTVSPPVEVINSTNAVFEVLAKLVPESMDLELLTPEEWMEAFNIENLDQLWESIDMNAELSIDAATVKATKDGISFYGQVKYSDYGNVETSEVPVVLLADEVPA